MNTITFRLYLVALSAFGFGALSSACAQNIVPYVQWERLYKDSACYFSSVVQTSDGGYILGGRVYDIADAFPQRDGVLVKLDSDGELQWQRTYGGTGHEEIASVRETRVEGYVFAASSGSPPSGDKQSPHFGMGDVWVVRTDAEGNIQWERTFGGTRSDSGASIRQTIDGGYVIAGWSDSSPSGNKEAERFGGADGWVIKIDGQGNKQWDWSFGGVRSDGFSSVRQTADGEYVLAGSSLSSWLIKVDAAGNKQWEQSFDSAANRLRSMDDAADGGFILGGVANSFHPVNEDFGDLDFWVVKVDASGNEQWEQSYGTPRNEELKVVRQTTEGGYILGGNSEFVFQRSSGTVIKTDSRGKQEWEEFFPSNDSTNAYTVEISDLRQTRDGGYVMCGSSESSNAVTSGSGCDSASWVAKLENVVSRSGEVMAWNADAGVVLESAGDLNGQWETNDSEIFSVGGVSALRLVPAGQQRFYRLRTPSASDGLPSISFGALLSWPESANQTLEFSASKDGPWAAFAGDQGILGETQYAIVPPNLQEHYFRTRIHGAPVEP